MHCVLAPTDARVGMSTRRAGGADGRMEAATEMQKGRRGCQVTSPEVTMDWAEAEPYKHFAQRLE